MPRNFVVWCCAVVAIAGQLVVEPPWARTQFDGGNVVGPDPELTAIERIEATLKQPLTAPLDFDETPLSEVLQVLAEEYGIPIIFDKAALDDVAISTDTEITARLSNITLKAALNLMLREPGLEDLTYVVDHQVLLITTVERANATLKTRVYRVDDFDLTSVEPEGGSSCFSSLQQVILDCVDHDAWVANGTGAGELHVMKPGMLVVVQTRSVHQKIESLLSALRATRAEIEEDAGSRRNGSGSF